MGRDSLNTRYVCYSNPTCTVLMLLKKEVCSSKNAQQKWNVTPLLGHFGGRVGIYRFLQSPPIPKGSPLSFVVGSYTLFSVFMRVNARLQARGTAITPYNY